MAKSKIELPTEEQVGAFIETYIPEPLASSFAALLNGMINLQSVEVDTGNDNEDDRPARGRGRGRAAEAENNNDDDAPPARGRGRGRAAAAQENNDDDAPPARSARGGRGRAAPASDDLLDDDDLLSNDDAGNGDNNDDDAPPARRGGGRGRAAAEDNNDDAPPARRGRGPARANDDNDDDAPPARGRGRQAEPEPENNDDDQGGDDQPITFEDLGGDEKTVGEYADTFMDGYKAKDIKADIETTWGIALKGTDVNLLANQAAEIYVAMETLTALPMKKLDKQLADFGVEVDYGRTKSEKTKVVMAARALVEVALENYEA